ncbi:AAA family ATPase [Spirochaetia bacterium 38H-sp]|uniref:AAA family ATPase n=1 Tax=Rarispira pelagica TaxID=3141764 RepID=A0ABU9UB80_9SPIR
MAAKDSIQTFQELDAVARHLRSLDKKVTLIFAYNGTGKTRLSMAFKEQGKQRNAEGETVARDTLYFNAFTEDLFFWDNDLEHDRERVLRMNTASRFFGGLEELEMESRIRRFLGRYADFQFDIDYKAGTVRFWRETVKNDDGEEEPVLIKVSRGEENMFIWCFFLAIAQLAIDGQEAYDWVKYLYIDDPISSLDENNAIAVAAHLVHMLKRQDRLKTVISSHHTLFFNVLCNEWRNQIRRGSGLCLFLRTRGSEFELQHTNDTPRFYHVAMLKELHKAAESGRLYTYHFNILRSILERTATFHGFNHFGDIIKRDPDDEDEELHHRYVQLLSHGNYSLFEPVEMLEENKAIFRKILNDFMNNYRFNPELFPEAVTEEVTA